MLSELMRLVIVKDTRIIWLFISTKSKSGKLSVIAVLMDRSKKGIRTFLKHIPDNLKKTVKSICTDMYDGFVYAAIEVFG
jgi:transposase